MKRALVAVLLVAFVALAMPARAGLDTVAYYSVSLIHPKTKRLLPIKVYYNGHFMLNRQMQIPYGSSLFVKVRAPRGMYLSAVFRDEASTIYDLPLKARKMTSDVKEFVWTMPRRFVPGDVQFYLCLWAGYNPDTLFMEGAVYKSQFLLLGKTQINL